MENIINPRIVPVILCGGTGKRLWPFSRESYPKQFLGYEKSDKKTFLQETYKRLIDLDNIDSPIIICNSEHRFIVSEQMADINVNKKHILLEPFSRNTAPAVGLAALKAIEAESDIPLLLVLPSDHFIRKVGKFVNTIIKGVEYAKDGRIVIFGVSPTYPETGYGYIELSNNVDDFSNESFSVRNFIEKPTKEIANKLVLHKRYLWNSGIFLIRADVALSELKKFAPKVYSATRNAMSETIYDLEFQRISPEHLEKCPNISFDKAVMEKTSLATVLNLDVGWSDAGNWDSLWDISNKDTNGNVIEGETILENVKNSYFKSTSRLVVGLDVSELIVVETFDAILVARKGSGQRVNDIVQILKDKNFKEASNHKKQFRPWGSYESIIEGNGYQVKRINVKKGASLSLQKHNHRTEHWVVVSGLALIEINNEKKLLKENESTYIPLGIKHRLSNAGEEELIIIEVQSGSYLGEDDIIRYEDKYGR